MEIKDKVVKSISIINVSKYNYNFDDWILYYQKNEKINILDLLHNVDWYDFFHDQKLKIIIDKINESLTNEISNGTEIFPYPDFLLTAFNYISPKDIKVIIIGQDPYPGCFNYNNKIIPYAMGLSFSIPNDEKLPSSLMNIMNNIYNYKHIDKVEKEKGNLFYLVYQGVLFINASLTIGNRKANSHQHIWNNFRIELIKYLNNKYENLIFVTWGKYAHSLCLSVDSKKHNIITSSHPSGYSCNNTFVSPSNENPNKFITYPAFNKVDHFGKINEILIKNKKEPIVLKNYLFD